MPFTQANVIHFHKSMYTMSSESEDVQMMMVCSLLVTGFYFSVNRK
jgi:hypothetical protein